MNSFDFIQYLPVPGYFFRVLQGSTFAGLQKLLRGPGSPDDRSGIDD